MKWVGGICGGETTRVICFCGREEKKQGTLHLGQHGDYGPLTKTLNSIIFV